jgi:hypothetical protein
MNSLARKIAACEALFDSPLAGEAAAARAAHARLISKHGKPKAKAKALRSVVFEESWGADETSSEREARLKRWDDYLDGKAVFEDAVFELDDLPEDNDVLIGRWLLDYGLWLEKLPGSPLIEPRWVILSGADRILDEVLWEDVTAFANALGYASHPPVAPGAGDAQSSAPAFRPHQPHSSHTERGQHQETLRA